MGQYFAFLRLTELCARRHVANEQRSPPDYFPPVFRTANGLMEKSPITNPAYLDRNPDAMSDPETLAVTPGQPIVQDADWLSMTSEPANREVYAGM